MKKGDYVLNNYNHKIWYNKNADRWCSFVRDETKPKKRRLVKRKNKDDLLNYLFQTMTNDAMTLEKLFELWFEYKTAISASSEYPKRILSDWKRYYANTALAKVPLSDLTPLMLKRWTIQTIKDFSLTKTAYNNLAIILRQGLDYAVELGYIPVNPFQKVKIDTRRLLRKPRKKNDCDQVFTDDEVEGFAKLAWEDFNNPGKKVYRLAPLAALFIFYTGLRVGELTGLKFEDVDNYSLHIRRMVRKDDHVVLEHTKTAAGERDIPLIPRAHEIIKVCREFSPGEWIFSEYNHPLPSRIVEEYFERYCQKLNTSQKSTHCARKTVASALVDNVNINTARIILGHSDERTTLRNYVYDRSSPDERYIKVQNALKYSDILPGNPG